MTFIKRLFIKNYKDTENPVVRTRYGIVAGIFGVVSNLIIFIAKLIIGIIGRSITIIAESVNNMADMASSATTVAGFKMASKPADKEHPFGHARFEYITGLIVSIIMLVIGGTLLRESIDKIIRPEPTTVTVYTYVILGSSIIVKIWQMLIYRNFAKSIQSLALKTSAKDSRNDIISTVIVIISSIIIHTTKINIDGYMGCAVSVFIMISSIFALKETINPLLGEKSDKQLVDRINNKLKSYPEIIGYHDLMIHNYGVNKTFAVVHAEVPHDTDFLEIHDLIDNIEKDFLDTLDVHLVIHMDPIVTNDPLTNEYRTICEETLLKLNPALSIHDFRVVFGTTHTNIIFDVVVPYDCKENLESLIAVLDAEFNHSVKYQTIFYFIVNIDRPAF